MSIKIFGIGLNKTGTTTLGQCGKILGLRTLSCNRELLEDVIIRDDLSNIKQIVEQYDLFEDWPWPLIYKELDLLFPGSKFILTIRKDEHRWLKSLKSHSLTTHPKLHCRKLAYGFNYPHSNEKAHIALYLKHRAEVNEYFKGRVGDFVELCWESGDGWNELCSFLNMDIPPNDFPHANRAIGRKVKLTRWLTNRFRSIFNS